MAGSPPTLRQHGGSVSVRAYPRGAGICANGKEVAEAAEIAIEEIDRVIASGVRFGCVLADSGTGPADLSVRL